MDYIFVQNVPMYLIEINHIYKGILHTNVAYNQNFNVAFVVKNSNINII